MKAERIAELEALCAAATPGPWEKNRDYVVSPAGDAELGNWLVAKEFRWKEDRDFVVAARTALPEALEEIKRQAAELEARDRELRAQEITAINIQVRTARECAEIADQTNASGSGGREIREKFGLTTFGAHSSADTPHPK